MAKKIDETQERQKQEQFVIDLTKNCHDHAQWLAVVGFGINKLIRDPAFLMELIAMESIKMHDDCYPNGRSVSDYARQILVELGLRFEQEISISNGNCYNPA